MPRLASCLAIALVALLSGCSLRNRQLRPYAGQWIMQKDGKNLAVLTTRVRHGRLVGTLESPKHLTEGDDGDFSDISPPIRRQPLHSIPGEKAVVLAIGMPGDADNAPLRLGANHDIYLAMFPVHFVPEWHLFRAPDSPQLTVATHWSEFSDNPVIAAVQRKIKDLVNQDQVARGRNPISYAELKQLADEAKPFLEQVFATYGWPRRSVFDGGTSDAFWLLVQHQDLAVQSQMLPAMKAAVDIGEASRKNYAYLFDRVEVGQGRPQHWGTQVHCAAGNQAILYPTDDPANLDGRRAALGLERIQQYLDSMRATCANIPPGGDK